MNDDGESIPPWSDEPGGLVYRLHPSTLESIASAGLAVTAMTDTLRASIGRGTPGLSAIQAQLASVQPALAHASGVIAQLRSRYSGFFDETVKPLAAAIERWTPPNWPKPVDWEQLGTVMADDGIPLTWVPRRSFVEKVLAAHDRPARVAELMKRRR